MNRKNRRHGPVKKALAILRYLVEHRFGATIAELGEETDAKPRNVYRYIAALQEAGIRVRNVAGRGPGVKAKFRLEDRPSYARLLGIV